MALSCGFKVKRSELAVVQPARATPIEVKSLSDIDNHPLLRRRSSFLLFYKHSGKGEGQKDPAETIKSALAEALVYYYPWAGRLKEGRDGKLVVDCTAEGVEFVEADADVRLDQFEEDSLIPPYLGIEELVYRSADAVRPLGSPLFSLQVTRLLCGGFVLGVNFAHTISDAIGATLFLSAISEIARGADVPSALPVWQRQELLNPLQNTPPQITHAPPLTSSQKQLDPSEEHKVASRSFFFGPREVATIRDLVPEHLKDTCTTFELTAACVLHCQAMSLKLAPEEQALLHFPVNCRNKFVGLPVPAEYYGNACAFAKVSCPIKDLHDLSCALEQVKKAKDSVNEDYARSFFHAAGNIDTDTFIPRNHTMFLFTDLSRVGLSTLDFRPWGRPLHIGLPHADRLPPRHPTFIMIPSTNHDGQEGRLVSLRMSEYAMETFDITRSSYITQTQMIDFNLHSSTSSALSICMLGFVITSTQVN